MQKPKCGLDMVQEYVFLLIKVLLPTLAVFALNQTAFSSIPLSGPVHPSPFRSSFLRPQILFPFALWLPCKFYYVVSSNNHANLHLYANYLRQHPIQPHVAQDLKLASSVFEHLKDKGVIIT
eukprot:353953-Amorphochlora_amoeboformis.AAC.3